MIPIAPGLAELFIVVIVGAVFTGVLVAAVLINRRTKSRPGYLVLSSSIIGTTTYVFSAVALMRTLPPLRWDNGAPQDLRTAVWAALPFVALIPTILSVILWQLARRRKASRAAAA